MKTWIVTALRVGALMSVLVTGKAAAWAVLFDEELPPSAGDPREPSAAVTAKDDAKEQRPPPVQRERYLKAARAGDTEARFRLGNADLEETGDLMEAVSWLDCAALVGHQGAREMLRDLGLALTPDSECRHPVEPAILAHDANADADQLYQTGNAHYFGNGVPQDHGIALEWMRAASGHGHALAIHTLGIMYMNGEGVEPDAHTALTFTRRAAELGVTDALNNLAWMYEKGKGVTADQTVANRYYLDAARAGVGSSQARYGYILETGIGMEPDPRQAAYWYRLAAAQGVSEAQVRLGALYYEGTGVDEDLDEACFWFAVAAELGDQQGMNNKEIACAMLSAARRNEVEPRVRQWLTQYRGETQ